MGNSPLKPLNFQLAKWLLPVYLYPPLAEWVVRPQLIHILYNYYRLAFFYELVKFTRWIKSAKFPENYVSCGYVDLWNDLDKNNYLSQTSSSFYVEKCSRRVLEWHITYQYNHKEIYIQRLELTGDLKKWCFLNQI